MTPQQAIAKLDRAIAKYGQTVQLRRGTTTAPVATASVKAHVRGYKPDELVSGIMQNDSLVILSPTGLENWPGGVPKKDDWATIDDRPRTIMAVGVFKMRDQVVRIELQVKG